MTDDAITTGHCYKTHPFWPVLSSMDKLSWPVTRAHSHTSLAFLVGGLSPHQWTHLSLSLSVFSGDANDGAEYSPTDITTSIRRIVDPQASLEEVESSDE